MCIYSVSSFKAKVQRSGSLKREFNAEGCLGDLCASSANEGHDSIFSPLLRTIEEVEFSRMKDVCATSVLLSNFVPICEMNLMCLAFCSTMSCNRKSRDT